MGFLQELKELGHKEIPLPVGKFNPIKPSEAAIRSRFSITKTVDEKQQVFGWAMVSHEWDTDKDGKPILKQLIDHQGDLLEASTLEDIAYNFVMKYREAGEMHERGDAGTCIESVCMTLEKQQAMGIPEGTIPVGWWLGFYIEDTEVWDKIKKGIYPDFSIEGTAIREEVEIPDSELDNYSVAK